jgi:hypothetical protein
MDQLQNQIDAYCERLEPGLWAEPLNAVTNFAFLIAAFIMWQRTAGDAMGRLLSGILGLIGIGSLLFHTVATGWAAMADTLPILLFILTYLYAINRAVLGWPVWGAALSVAAFVPYAAALVPLLDRAPFLRISNFYWTVPVLLVLYALALMRRRPSLARGLALGAAILSVSISLRSLDLLWCATWPMGTHFLWHGLNALMLGWMIAVYQRHRLAAGRPER